MTSLPASATPSSGARERLRGASELGRNLGAWVHDYAYALRRQASGLLRGPDPKAYRRPESGKPAVLLLPGIYETWAFMLPVANVLREQGYDVHAVVDLGYNGGTIEDMADLVDDYIRREGVQRCVLVAHSKGGLIGKLLLTRQSDADPVLGLVTLNTPFEGSQLARLLPLPALRLFLPRSPELAELGASRDVDADIISIYGRFDPHIPGGSRLEGAHNVQLETRGHFLPLSDARAHKAILDGVRRITG
ncbi:alpha/beta hydrolase [Nesterenkonia sp. LB17]|uniref:esterase/lipase family protein n=1 Tax=unclassified Nesterenkonia TaxID=2629769 RepID=UPI001F4C864B|nr:MULTISPECIES: alpha/beta hydrolase [unclassified Nesterenkonia]MCH8560767.1 alpha/beta hydrolase [Nesterenkonia sp. DZ6]MCH8563624.1 alpha/beta hydrolase [Nesterenkonia sp. YGD6]MCH8566272.1 alpha/beta hydrolase [Nesterenkonia sp. LB17]MCH8570849.1 alpha/beta hydrolase [Nesterenkonia sp. AY15]